MIKTTKNADQCMKLAVHAASTVIVHVQRAVMKAVLSTDYLLNVCGE